MNNQSPADDTETRSLLSAMADGQADATEVARGCAAWADADGDARQRWQAYQLIGDVLRSDDLACAPARDRAFLQRLSARLDDEPAVLAPRPLPVAAKGRPGWVMPVALAAGVMALATVLVLAVGPDGGAASAPTLAAAPAGGAQATVQPASTTVAEAMPPGGRVVRDAQLDHYLRAHRDYAAALPGSLPGGSGRSIATVAFER